MANLNTAISPSPVVEVYTRGGVLATGYTGNVTVSLSTNPTGATLGGTRVVAASGGVATFSNLTLNRSGKGFRLRATAATQGQIQPRAQNSRPFDIATRLYFIDQPQAAGVINVPLNTIRVGAQDSANTADTFFNGRVTLSIYEGNGGQLSGTTTVNAVNGVATFTGLSINVGGTYKLIATSIQNENPTCYPASASISNSFTIVYPILISGNNENYNVYESFVDNYGQPPSNISVLIAINENSIISSPTTSQPALRFGNQWGSNTTFSLTNFGYVIGCGGNGGNSSDFGGSPDGTNGGIALEADGQTITVINALGYIWGGGGGGGGSMFGGGGGGAGNGIGGQAATPSNSGQNASLTGVLISQTGGAGGDDAGNGGDYGENGQSSGGFGGFSGNSVSASGGIVSFFSGGTSPNLKGPTA